ncbi:MAG: hypothetical protein JSS41_00275 [Proteobacteria bacterium]|nr:hypothetical protein [Pseudomonadota bacterium]
MLIAWARGKHRSDQTEYEDEVVSSVFGPLLYFTDKQRATIFWHLLCGIRAYAQNDFTSNIFTAKIEFWPSIVNERRVEPDILVTLTPPSGSQTLLMIEAKWNSGLSKDQLKQQWDALRCSERYSNGVDVRHVFLSKKFCTHQEMKVSDATHVQRLTSISWAQLVLLLQHLNNDPTLKMWADHVQSAMTRLGQVPFNGFTSAISNFSNKDRHNGWRFQPRLLHPSALKSLERWTEASEFSTWKFNDRRNCR